MIVVSDEKIISALQQEFQENFPFLRLDFFRLNGSASLSKSGNDIPLNTPFGRYKNLNTSSAGIAVTPEMSVAELVKQFEVQYGLSAQIFRKSGKAWLETRLTESWTLQEQNEQGRALSADKPLVKPTKAKKVI